MNQKFFPSFLILILVLAVALSCNFATSGVFASGFSPGSLSQEPGFPGESVSQGDGSAQVGWVGQPPADSLAPVGEFVSLYSGNKPPQSVRAEIYPPEMRADLTLLSNLVGFQIFGQDGQLVGVLSDFVINTCETYVIYLLISPPQAEGQPEAAYLALPFEVVTINSGLIDVRGRRILINLVESQLENAPHLPASQALVPVDWEKKVRAFWSKQFRISGLTTGCRVSSPQGGMVVVHKIATFSALRNASLFDGQGKLLGTVEEAVLEPESGKIGFFVIRLHESGALVLVPLKAVNIPKESLQPGAQLTLVLLTEPGLLLQAPTIADLSTAKDLEQQSLARGYWNR